MRLVPIECVRGGSLLGKTLYDNDGRILLKAGITLTENLILRIKRVNILSIYIVDKYSDLEIDDIIKPELRQKSVQVLKETFNNVERLISCTPITPKGKYEQLKQCDEYFNSIHSIAEELLDNILNNKNLLVSLVDIKSMDNYTYQHSVNVAIISVVLGVGLKLPKRELVNLCVGGLIHDIGKVLIPKEIIVKQGPLTYDEFQIMKEHPQKGYDYISKNCNITTASKLIIHQHHEKIDGTGYPNGLSGSKINKLARIVAIADVYDALTSNRPYRRALCASDALEYIMANADKAFDFEMVRVFSKVIVPFPFGTIVELSNGDIGVVQETIPNYPLRPYIKIIKSEKNSSLIGNTVSLVDELSLVISNVQYDI